jgi:hypothetical protein
MLAVLENLLNTLLVIGTSLWGWLGLVAEFGGALLIWHTLELSAYRAPTAALGFITIFVTIY